ncbi:hypothetical protein RHABOEDO_000048 [Candidatus Rhabdochlamydia oedothoracis]|uniref:Uncharacterized protein n=1 Tax=Candidatus Rhabdochlamydia oedothoracis TaxID=2720720 RepID=A0ABX8V3E1_9BACT|nr:MULTISPECIES: hypothetical protein [Rhabdochlamydia]KAG6559582.1 hypothetical protein RHOW815_000396 [Candidatus Rhabdochlamydia sp. W815]MCL6756096.1 hypothetical protein [Candidatus Rhabdochlamydia oedothoracis]QYF47975.1 hypothetical protein RHABOEDO_000048 [Candidatus Rhabdochlamydia oedothoracis]
MQLRGKSLYNLLRVKHNNNPKTRVAPWQIEDLRELKLATLFTRLGKIGIFFNEVSFVEQAQQFDNPEELTKHIWPKEEEGQAKCYLLLFELWRRLLPENLPISLFCDQLDCLIDAYDRGSLVEVDQLQEALESLEDILDNAADKEGSAEEVFLYACSYSAHDLEGFILDYIANQMIEENYVGASKFLDGFSPYVIHKKRFEALRICLFLSTDTPSASLMFDRFLEYLQEEPDFESLLILMDYLVYRGNREFFFKVVKQALLSMKTEEQFQDVLEMMAEYYHYMDLEEEERHISQISNTRKNCPVDVPLNKRDPIYLDIVKAVLENT